MMDAKLAKIYSSNIGVKRIPLRAHPPNFPSFRD